MHGCIVGALLTSDATKQGPSPLSYLCLPNKERSDYLVLWKASLACLSKLNLRFSVEPKVCDGHSTLFLTSKLFMSPPTTRLALALPRMTSRGIIPDKEELLSKKILLFRARRPASIEKS